MLCDIKVIKQSHDHIAVPEKIALRMTYYSDLQVPIVKESKSDNFPLESPAHADPLSQGRHD